MKTTKSAQAIFACKHRLIWGRQATLIYAQRRNIVALYRLCCQLEAAQTGE